MDSRRYHLYQQGKNFFLFSTTSKSIIEAVSGGSSYSYDELSEKTGIPVSSLYVFCQRLEEKKLLTRRQAVSGNPRRVRTVISTKKKFMPHPLKIVK